MPILRAVNMLGAIEEGTLDATQLGEEISNDVGVKNDLTLVLETDTMVRRVTTSDTSVDTLLHLGGEGAALVRNSRALQAIARSPSAMDTVTQDLGTVQRILERPAYFGEMMRHAVSANRLLSNLENLEQITENPDLLEALYGADVGLAKVLAMLGEIDSTQILNLGHLFSDAEQTLAVFGNATARRVMFDSVLVERALQGSRTALTALKSSPLSHTATGSVPYTAIDAPSPLNTPGKWFILEVTALFVTGRYGRAIDGLRHDAGIQTGHWSTFTIRDVYGLVSSRNRRADQMAYAGPGNNSYSALHSRFATQLGVMTRAGTTGNATQTYLYIDMA